MSSEQERIRALTLALQHMAAELSREQEAHAATRAKSLEELAQHKARIAQLEERIEELKTDLYRTENALNNLLGY
jgi:chromosome segregation ATPase